MNDPEVVALFYRLVSQNDTFYDNPPDITQDLNDYRLQLCRGLLTIDMKKDCATEGAARKLVEPFLRAWEIYTALSEGRNAIRFKFERSKIIDRAPDPPGQARLRSSVIVSAAGRLTGQLQLKRSHYPQPPNDFVLCPDAETMWRRYLGHKEGREPLNSMAYLCLTILEKNAGDRKRAAVQYGFDHAVLSKLGYLCSEVGDDQTARKRSSQSHNRPHTAEEQTWIDAVIRSMVRRVGEYAHDPTRTFNSLTMSDFPPL